MTEFDYIVAGAGSGGAVLATRLAQAGRRVLLVEAGQRDRSPWIHIPMGVGKILNNPQWVWKFNTEPQGSLRGQQIYSPRGKVLGGSSSVNGMAYIWGDPAEFDSWTRLGVQGWCFEDVQPYFARIESNGYSDHPKRGRNGPIKITDRSVVARDPISDAFIQSCLDLGIAKTPDYNVVSYEGVRYLEQNAHRGRRFSTAVGYLRPNLNNPNLTVWTDATFEKVLFEGNRATGAVITRLGERMSVKCREEVVLACGAFKTPQILELSGIGDPTVLREHGIETKIANPLVGNNLSDHLQVRYTYKTNLPITLNDLARSPWVKLKAVIQYLLFGKGLLSGTSSTAHAITRVSSTANHVDAMIRLYQISGTDRYSRSPSAGLDKFPGFSIGGFLLYPQSRGSVHIRSADPQADPLIDPNYLAATQDQVNVVRLLKRIGQIAQQPSMRKFIVEQTRPAADLNDDQLLDYAKQIGQTAWHSVGTCQMGLPGRSVVDSELRVHGIENLRIGDISVLPTIVSSNTNAAAMMIGERLADFMLKPSRGIEQ